MGTIAKQSGAFYILNEKDEGLKNSILDGFIDKASVQIDTIESFMETEPKPRICTHFAVGYFNAKVSEENMQRTENIKNAVNQDRKS